VSESKPWLEMSTPAACYRLARDWWEEQPVVTGFACDFAAKAVCEWERKCIVAKLRDKAEEYQNLGGELEWRSWRALASFADELEEET
jgi:hypothetical protein